MPTLFLTKVSKTYDEEKQSLLQSWRKKWLPACRKLKLEPCLSPCASISSKWIKDLNISLENSQLVEERSGNTLEAIGIGKDFLSRIPSAQQLRERMNKWDYIKLKPSAQQKKWSLNWRDHPQSVKKYLLATHQRTDNQNIQWAQKTKLPRNQWTNEEVGNRTKKNF
jgi:hypothetical protein